MKLEFNNDGNLPKGIINLPLDGVKEHFGNLSARRKWLIHNLEKILDVAKSTNKLQKVFLWGSFVSNKEMPNDIDIFLVMKEDFNIENLDEEAKMVFDYTQAKIKYCSDIFWCKNSIGNDTIKIWLDTYQKTRDFKERGIVEIKI